MKVFSLREGMENPYQVFRWPVATTTETTIIDTLYEDPYESVLIATRYGKTL